MSVIMLGIDPAGEGFTSQLQQSLDGAVARQIVICFFLFVGSGFIPVGVC
jgi:hypothetical protein